VWCNFSMPTLKLFKEVLSSTAVTDCDEKLAQSNINLYLYIITCLMMLCLSSSYFILANLYFTMPLFLIHYIIQPLIWQTKCKTCRDISLCLSSVCQSVSLLLSKTVFSLCHSAGRSKLSTCFTSFDTLLHLNRCGQ
jgi:hypothetical protein